MESVPLPFPPPILAPFLNFNLFPADARHSLAYAELHIALAMIIRRFDLELVDTEYERDIEVVRDCFLGEARPGSVGVKVRVVGVCA